MGYLEQAVRSRWAVPMTAFLIQLSQYWNTLVTVTWWSKRATVSVVWFCVHPAAGNIPEQAVPIPGTLPAGHARHRGSYPHGHAGHIAAVRKTVAHTGIRRSRVSDHHVYDMPTDRQHRTDDQQGTPA